ncbi:MAG: virulence RhuM family protein, partial [Elusimicrobiota bacterium]|nr:virulence RhuM family protein [Elusimicrobiota bacterium]
MNKEPQFLIYGSQDVKVKVVIKDETIWLTQKEMAALFGVQKSAISKHISNIYSEGELIKYTTVSKMETVVNRGYRGQANEVIDFYNLDMIIAVGYRVNSSKATQFRIWATKVLKEFIVKGFAIDDNRLKE